MVASADAGRSKSNPEVKKVVVSAVQERGGTVLADTMPDLCNILAPGYSVVQVKRAIGSLVFRRKATIRHLPPQDLNGGRWFVLSLM